MDRIDFKIAVIVGGIEFAKDSAQYNGISNWTIAKWIMINNIKRIITERVI